VRVEAGVAYPEGDMTLDQANRLLAEGVAVVASGSGEFDFKDVQRVDSAALSLMLAWQRRAGASSKPLSFRNVPENLRALAALYGIGDLLLG
jgi:phospholipid transport system transporter-binding protein